MKKQKSKKKKTWKTNAEFRDIEIGGHFKYEGLEYVKISDRRCEDTITHFWSSLFPWAEVWKEEEK